MITFEAGTLLQQNKHSHFGSLVSHVTRRWRRVALATPFLWTNVRFTKWDSKGGPYPEIQTERAAAFIFRSLPLPVEFDIDGLDVEDLYAEDDPRDATPAFLQLIIGHIGRCHRLCIVNADPQSLSLILTFFCSQAAPLLRSIELGRHINSDDTWEFKEPPFQLGAPHLATAQLFGIHIPCTPDFLSAFQQLTSLRICSVFMGYQDFDADPDVYNEFRDGLMALPLLNHLDLQIDEPFSKMASRFPIVLPTLHFLRLDAIEAVLGDMVHSIQASSLIALSLGGWDIEEDYTAGDQMESHFPSLEHLIIIKDLPDLDVFARSFPRIKRLTCDGRLDIDHLLTHMRAGAQCDDENDASVSDDWNIWPALQVIAVSASHGSSNPTEFIWPNMLSKLKSGDHPLRKLLLPKAELDQAEVDALVELRKLVEVEDFSVNWPNPFA